MRLSPVSDTVVAGERSAERPPVFAGEGEIGSQRLSIYLVWVGLVFLCIGDD